MKKKFYLTALTLLAASGALCAAPLSPEQALLRLQESGNPEFAPGTRAMNNMELKLTKRTTDGKPSLYVFDKSDKGFMVVSADDATVPLLGYSDNGKFDPDNVPPQLMYWLGEYDRQIEYLRANDQTMKVENEQVPDNLPDWAPIKPLLKTTWNQRAPYNQECPIFQQGQAATGCVATSVSQVMNYFQYPEKGRGNIQYQVDYGTQYAPLWYTYTCDFNDIYFDWDNMLDDYQTSPQNYNQTQAEAVATLMAAVGYAVQMSFNYSESGAISSYISGALIKYFDYDPSVTYVTRQEATYTEWATMIYNNIKNVGPVVYGGQVFPAGGHSFVCDGYDGNGYFHFNWGWGGLSDGYYLLDVLNPPAIGTGGYSGGFNFQQDVVLNIQKPKAGSKPVEDRLLVSGSVYGEANTYYLYMKMDGAQYPGFRYFGNEDALNFDIGCSIVEADNPSAEPKYYDCYQTNSFSNISLDSGHAIYCNGSGNFPYPNFYWRNLDIKENVRYKVTAAYKPKGGDWMETDTFLGCYNYFYFTKTANGYEFENMKLAQLTCEELVPTTQLYNGVAGDFDVTLTNNADYELTRGVTLYLLDNLGNVAFYGESFVVTLMPGETYSTNFLIDLKKNMSGSINTDKEFYLALYDFDTNTIYYKSDTPVIMKPEPARPVYTCKVEIEDAPLKNGLYQVPFIDFQASVSVNVTQSVFSYPINLYVLENTTGSLQILQTYNLDTQVIDAGQTGYYVQKIEMPNVNVGQVYYIGIQIVTPDTTSGDIKLEDAHAEFVVLSNQAGVESIVSSPEDGIYKVYNLSGIKVLETTDVNVVNELPKGIYIVNGKKVMVR